MSTKSIDNTNFQGKLKVLGRYSSKPQKCINQVKNEMEKLIAPKGYNMYLKQDYCKNEVIITCGYNNQFRKNKNNNIQTNVPIVAKASKYLDAARKAIEEYDNNNCRSIKLSYVKEQKRDLLEEIIKFPIFLFELVSEIFVPGLGIKIDKFFNNMVQKFITKKG